MARGFPSMTALLGMIAVAGYQNRDKIAEMLRGQPQGPGGAVPSGQAGQTGQGQGGLGGLLGNLGSGGGGLLTGGLSELVESFRQTGHAETAESWIGTGPNREVTPSELEQAIGPDVLATLTEKTGLSREDLLSRLSRELPEAVDKYTPEGRLPGSQQG